jgi:cytochrome c oxidase assembly protein subunit 15
LAKPLLSQRHWFAIALLATFLAWFVVMLGAYTRLGDAGLGCPDWPGCYGQVTVPKTVQQLQNAEKLYPNQPVEAAKAWKEMVHRYFAGTLATLIFILAIQAFRKNRLAGHSKLIACLLTVAVIFQAVLGMWTVTWKVMPSIVMSHLLGGLAVFGLLGWLSLRLGQCFNNLPADTRLKKFRFWVGLGLVILILQITLGGWTSTNYAALICPDFPACIKGHWLPLSNFKQAFDFFTPIGPDYQGGLLDVAARMTIQMMHRLGALVTFVYLTGLAVWMLRTANTPVIRKLLYGMLALLIGQILLGIFNVLWLLPMPIAVAHNGVAALLLLTMICLSYSLAQVTK